MGGHIKNAAILICSIFAAGCATIPVGYVPDYDWKEAKQQEPNHSEDITYSVSFGYDIGRFDAVSKADVVKMVREKLRETGWYQRIIYAPPDQRSDHHLHFRLMVTGTKYEQSQALAMLSGFTMMLIPVWADYYADMSLHKLNGNGESFSSSAPEKIVQVLWLPLIVAAPVANNYTASSWVLTNQIEYLLSELANNRANL
ncbi:hypothetical protein RM531_15825 [Salinisphaera sp. P385]|uniref:Lipoprotein n=1 Tax=Spectribacter acetivorans TaxID=3075603 RepID=A0ABU3BDH4_9GAMM|nr:hypothetical protein [Salinisphaera sp. P385]MDT0619937.1 hypothetical protein [Salinisphaera sp. P385]